MKGSSGSLNIRRITLLDDKKEKDCILKKSWREDSERRREEFVIVTMEEAYGEHSMIISRDEISLAY